MDRFAIPVFRYYYREPQGKIPCDYLESTQNTRTLFMETGRTPLRIVAREVGGSNDNHVQWVSVDKIVPVADDNNNNDAREADKNEVSLTFRGTGFAHGVIRHASWQHSVGDKIWLRSDIPLFKGRKAVPIVNLTQGRSAEAYIRDIDWIPQKRSKGWTLGSPSSFLLTIAGPKFPYYSPSLGPHRMAIVVDRMKELHAPLPTFTKSLSANTTAASAAYYNHYDINTVPAEPRPLSPEEREMERIDEERARLDNDPDHYTLRTITVDELNAGFENVVDIMEVSVATPIRRRRLRGEGPDSNNGDGVVEHDCNQDVTNRMAAGLVAVFSEESLGLDMGLDVNSVKRG